MRHPGPRARRLARFCAEHGRERQGLASVAAASPTAFAIAACGPRTTRTNPRPPAPIEVTARVGDDQLEVQPSSRPGAVGAGLVTFTVSNQSADPVELSRSRARPAAASDDDRPGPAPQL